MEVTINDKRQQITDNETVATVIGSIYRDSRGIAVAINGKIVKKTEWNARCLNEGDDVVIIKAAYGG